MLQISGKPYCSSASLKTRSLALFFERIRQVAVSATNLGYVFQVFCYFNYYRFRARVFTRSSKTEQVMGQKFSKLKVLDAEARTTIFGQLCRLSTVKWLGVLFLEIFISLFIVYRESRVWPFQVSPIPTLTVNWKSKSYNIRVKHYTFRVQSLHIQVRTTTCFGFKATEFGFKYYSFRVKHYSFRVEPYY